VKLVLEAARRCVVGPAPAIVVETDADLPPVWADHDRLEQVFVNLLDNAVRHASGSTRIAIDARHQHPAAVVVRVTDDGAGIPEELGERVFLPHERGAAAGPGVGLGLAIAKGIVEAHGGRIGLAAVEKGTAVEVVIPVEPAGVAEDAGLAGTAGGDLDLPAGAGRRA
jgi:signal transduction histidine kinase